jgi:hypothetical protein
MGEPIKVGHHSEREHRAALDRADRTMRKSIDASDAVTEADRRAETATHTTGARYSASTVQNRVKRLAAEGRKLRRTLDGQTDRYGSIHAPAAGEHKDRIEARIAEVADQLEYWQGVESGLSVVSGLTGRNTQ